MLYVFLDDAQAKYGDGEFWKLLLKMSLTWLPGNIRFIIVSTHHLAGVVESQVELRSLPCLQRSDFLLSAEEADQFLDFDVIGLPRSMRFSSLKALLIKECGGLVGALRLSVDSLKYRFLKDIEPSELALLQHVMSNSYVAHMDRCFGSAHSFPIGDDFKQMLKRIFVDEEAVPRLLTNANDKKSYLSLQKAGILVDQSEDACMFSSPLAKRYYFKWIFLNRSSTDPVTLYELVRNVVASMSSNLLKHSTVDRDFPKEAVFQHLFMDGLARFTRAGCSICPELSKVFPRDPNSGRSDGAIAGEIDFYLGGNLRWGIALRVNGDGIGAHLSQFSPTGKYSPLCVDDYAVVDIRRTKAGQPTSVDKRIQIELLYGLKTMISRAHNAFLGWMKWLFVLTWLFET